MTEGMDWGEMWKEIRSFMMVFIGDILTWKNWNKGVEDEMKKSIFFIISSFSKGGGAESLLTTIVNNLDPNKYDIGIMEIEHADIKVEPVNENIKIYPYYVRADDPERNIKMRDVYHAWDKVIAEYIPQDYDLYVSFNYLKPTFLLPPGKKNIAWIHGDVYNLIADDKTEEYALQDKAFEKVDKIVSISDITTESLERLFPRHKDKIEVIYNGIDIKRIRERAKEETQIVLEHPAILSIGRLDKNKDPLHLLDIFTQVNKKDPKAHLYYLGYGDLSESVLCAAKRYGVSDYVHLLGYQENPFPVIAQCDVIGMFSISEGFPMALLEGVALDKPFVSSIIGGSRILANNQRCGKTVQRDEEAVEAIIDFIKTEKKALVFECRKSIEKFGLEKYIGQIEKIFDE